MTPLNKQIIILISSVIMALGLLFVVLYIINRAKTSDTADVASNPVVSIFSPYLKQSSTDTLKLSTTEDERGLGYNGQHKIAQDSKGNMYVVYRKYYKDSYEVFISKTTPDTSFSKSQKSEYLVSNMKNDTNQRVPAIAIDKNDILHITWYGADSKDTEGARQVKYAHSKDAGKTWSKWRNISVVEGYKDEDLWQEHPDILAASDGALYIAWEGKDATMPKQQIKISKSIDGGKSWSTWKNLQPSPENTQSRPMLTETSDGKVHIIMYSSMGNSGVQQIWHTYSTDKGSNWKTWTNISNSKYDSRHASFISLDNNLYAVWRSQLKDNQETQILFSMWEEGKWYDPIVATTNSSYKFFPSIGANVDNTIAVSWVETPNISDFPREQPKEKVSAYIAYYNKNTRQFKDKTAIQQQNNIFYPHILPKNKSSKSFYITYLDGVYKKDLSINLLQLISK